MTARRQRGPRARLATAGAGSALIVAALLAGCGQGGTGGTAAAGGTGTHPAASQSGAGPSRAAQSPGGQQNGGQSPGGQSPGAQSPGGAPMMVRSVCDAPSAVTRVRVTRLPAIGQMDQGKPVRKATPGIVVRDPGRARGLARLICGLPRVPRGVHSCPIDIGGGYQLVFTAAGRHLPAVTIHSSGCETVTGSSPREVRWVSRSPQFWAALSRLTGIQSPAHTP